MAPLLSEYCERWRGNPLVIFGVDDALYASVLPLPRIRYCFVGFTPPPTNYALNFRETGIMLTAPQFDELEKWEDLSVPRLRSNRVAW